MHQPSFCCIVYIIEICEHGNIIQLTYDRKQYFCCTEYQGFRLLNILFARVALNRKKAGILASKLAEVPAFFLFICLFAKSDSNTKLLVYK
jgi:hypothetical protein